MTTGIEWCDETWNPIVGCSPVSEGCRHCYAARMAHRLAAIPATRERYRGLTRKAADGRIVFNGTVRLASDVLRRPRSWRKPKRIFVGSMTDLFHEQVPFEWIDRVMEEIHHNPHHTFIMLTKRPSRMACYWSTEFVRISPNIWAGVSICTQAEAADENGDIDAAAWNLWHEGTPVRILSCEPLLEPIDIRHLLDDRCNGMGFNWVIAGGESGPGWRDVPDDAFRSLRDQCREAGVPFFMKQLPGRRPIPADLQIREFPG